MQGQQQVIEAVAVGQLAAAESPSVPSQGGIHVPNHLLRVPAPHSQHAKFGGGVDVRQRVIDEERVFGQNTQTIGNR